MVVSSKSPNDSNRDMSNRFGRPISVPLLTTVLSWRHKIALIAQYNISDQIIAPSI